jgi:hypothetical protein
MRSQSNVCVVHQRIHWKNYRAVDLRDNPSDEFAFRGVIHYIWFNSNQQYNAGEILVEYSSMAFGSDPVNLLDSTTPACFTSGSTGSDCLEFTFPRAAVRPAACVIKCGQCAPLQSLQWSFVFQGWEPQTQTWVMLSERRHEFRPCFRWRGFPIDTERWFHKFRFFYTGTLTPGVPSFSIPAFEIHGDVVVEDGEDSDERENEHHTEEEMEFDPWSIAETEVD